MPAHPSELVPFLKLYEEAVTENCALRMTLEPLPGWDDSTVNANKEICRLRVAPQFAVLYELSNNPHQLDKALSAMLKREKRN